MEVLINNSIKVCVDKDGLIITSKMFKDLIEECGDFSTIPITFKYLDIAKNYLTHNFKIDNTDVNELVKYLEFAHYIIDDVIINNISQIIANNVAYLRDEIIGDLSYDVEMSILEKIPRVNGLQYLYYKYESVRKKYKGDIMNNSSYARDKIKNRSNKNKNIDFNYLESIPLGEVGSIRSYQYDKNITIEEIEKDIDKWDWKELSEYNCITEEFVEKYIDKPWEWGIRGFSRSSWVTEEFIERHIDKPWDWGEFGLSQTRNISIDFMEKYINKRWNWAHIGYKSKKFKLIIDYKNFLHKRDL